MIEATQTSDGRDPLWCERAVQVVSRSDRVVQLLIAPCVVVSGIVEAPQ